MKVVIWKAPKYLRGLLRAIFKVKEQSLTAYLYRDGNVCISVIYILVYFTQSYALQNNDV